jgi:hypothetical protein
VVKESARYAVRVLEEAGLAAPSYGTLKRRLPVYAKDAWRRKLFAACGARWAGPGQPGALRRIHVVFRG